MYSAWPFGLVFLYHGLLSMAAPQIPSSTSSTSSSSSTRADHYHAPTTTSPATVTPPSFRDIVGSMMGVLPLQLSNDALPTATNASISIPSFTGSLPSAAPSATLESIGDYTLVPHDPHRVLHNPVPHTPYNITFTLANTGQVPAIPPLAMAKTILSLNSTLQSRLLDSGDRWLSNDEDPMGWEIGLGCWMEFWSNPAPGVKGRKQHLTLTAVIGVMEGLMERLVKKGLYDFAYVEVFNAQWGLMGMGFVAPDEGPLNKTNKIANVLATLRIEGKK